jgi:hypothetical protein
MEVEVKAKVKLFIYRPGQLQEAEAPTIFQSLGT